MTHWRSVLLARCRHAAPRRRLRSLPAGRVCHRSLAGLPDGAPDQVVRTVTENARTLKFKEYGFEEE